MIVDDEKGSREIIRKLLNVFFSEIEVVTEAGSVEEAYINWNSYRPELVFLDIRMPESNGFNLLKKFDNVPFEVIFVTSFDEFAITAIKFNALGYLLKPVELDDFKEAVLKAIRNIQKQTNSQPQIINLMQNLVSEEEDKRFAVHVNDKVKLIKASEVVYIEAEGRYSNVKIENGEVLITARNLKEFEDFFEADPYFLRISKGLIINARFVTEYMKGDPFVVTMNKSEFFEVSRRKKTVILEKLTILR